MLKRQLMFDTAVAALYKQGRVSVTPGGEVCQYRGENGAKCALGHLIPDRRYDTDLEGLIGNEEPVLKAIGAKYGTPSLDGEDADFVRDMQGQLHDELAFGEDADKNYRHNLKKAAAPAFARQYGLTFDPAILKC